ncbi:MAG: lytic murein transglycosylase, partial [Pseudomonadota bacterium]
MRSLKIFAVFAAFAFPIAAQAAQCGNSGGGYAAWKTAFAAEAKASGIKSRGLQALAGTQYATRTIAADRNQKSFKYSLEKFMQVRGASTIVSQGRKRKAQNAAYFQRLEQQYGVPAGVIIAIHGMETGFGRFMGDSNVLSAIATLAYDCRRTEFFTGHLLAALKLVDRGIISPASVGARLARTGCDRVRHG